MKVIVAIPCYNCEKQIPRVLKGFDRDLLARIDRILVIDNRSKDGSAEAARRAVKELGLEGKVSVLRNRENYGLGGTHKVAFLTAEREGADYLGILHGDDQGVTAELKMFLDEAQAHPQAAAILGARFMPGSRLPGYPLLRILGNRALNLAYTLLSGRRTWDMGAGMNLFRVRDLKDRAYLGFTDAFTFNMDLLLHYFRSKAKLVYIPITWSETDQVSNARTFRVGWIALKTLLIWRLGLSERLSKTPQDYASELLDLSA